MEETNELIKQKFWKIEELTEMGLGIFLNPGSSSMSKRLEQVKAGDCDTFSAIEAAGVAVERQP